MNTLLCLSVKPWLILLGGTAADIKKVGRWDGTSSNGRSTQDPLTGKSR